MSREATELRAEIASLESREDGLTEREARKLKYLRDDLWIEEGRIGRAEHIADIAYGRDP